MKKISAMKDAKNMVTIFGVFGSFLIFGLLVAFFYSPVFKSHATPDKSTHVAVGVNPTIAIAVDKDELNLSALMNSFVHGQVNVSVLTNSYYGYTLGIEDADTDSSMHHTDSGITDVVTSSFLGPKTSSQMADNTWGYSLDGTDYYYVPLYGIPAILKNVDERPADVDTTTVDFGAKVGVLTAGTYSDTVLFSAYVNGEGGYPSKVMTEPGYQAYMQDFNSRTCIDKMEIGDVVTLVDYRDGESYRVKKMPDGECWMIDNLRLSVTDALTSRYSSVFGDFTIQYASSVEDFAERVGATLDPINLAYVDPEKGGFYTWKTATAGYEYGSICPDSWGLPHHYDYNYLYNSLETPAVSMRTYFPISDGYIAPGGSLDTDSSRFWTRDESEEDTQKAYAELVGYYGSHVYEDYKNYGFHIRCVAVPPK